MIENPSKIDEPLSSSRMVRDALARRGRNALNAVESPPIFCYSPQCDEIRSLFQLMFVMSPMRACHHPTQIPDDPHPLFVYCRYSIKAVPQEFWDRLDKLKALYLCVDIKKDA